MPRRTAPAQKDCHLDGFQICGSRTPKQVATWRLLMHTAAMALATAAALSSPPDEHRKAPTISLSIHQHGNHRPRAQKAIITNRAVAPPWVVVPELLTMALPWVLRCQVHRPNAPPARIAAG